MKTFKIMKYSGFNLAINTNKTTTIEKAINIIYLASRISISSHSCSKYVYNHPIFDNNDNISHVVITTDDAVIVVKEIKTKYELILVKLDNFVRKVYFYLIIVLLSLTFVSILLALIHEQL